MGHRVAGACSTLVVVLGMCQPASAEVSGGSVHKTLETHDGAGHWTSSSSWDTVSGGGVTSALVFHDDVTGPAAHANLMFSFHTMDGSMTVISAHETDSITRKLFALIARACQMLGDSEAALRTCAQGLQLDAADAELWFRKAVVHRQRGEPAEAERCWRRILTLGRPEQFCSVDEGIYGHPTRRNLAVLAMEGGEHQEAIRLWAEVLAECPGDPEVIARLNELAPEHPALKGSVVGAR